MKVVCESCQAKYQVPDAKVAGKRLKIRCKRCGETVLIRGDMMSAGTDDVATVAAAPMPGAHEWHVSVEGEVSGPFGPDELASWLVSNPAGWDAFVWREGFPIWLPARDCDEVVAAVGGAGGVSAAVSGEEEATRMFQSDEDEAYTQAHQPALHARSSIAPAAAARPHQAQRSSIFPASAAYAGQAARASIAPQIPARTSQAPEYAPRTNQQAEFSARAMQALGSRPPAVAASRPPESRPRQGTPSSMRAPSEIRPRTPSRAARVEARATPAEHPEDSVLFSTQNLRQVAQSGSHPAGYAMGSSPGYARGEGSGLIDIRALATLAQQQHAASLPSAATGGHASAVYAMRARGAGLAVDSIAPIATGKARHSSTLPIAVFSGFALLAAALFAAIVVTHKAGLAAATVPTPAATPVTPVAATAAAAQPVAPAPAELVAAAPAPVLAAEPVAAEPVAEEAKPEVSVAEPAKAERVASSKRASKHRPRGERAASEREREKEAQPQEKTKAKEKDKAPPPSLDDVMLAGKSDAKEAELEEPAAAVAPAEKNSDIDDLLADKPTKEPAKERSFDDLLDGAVTKGAVTKKAAPAAEALPESPSREETLSAMRGVEPAVRACAANDDLAGTTAEVQIQVSGSSGKVTSSSVGGVSGPVATCIAKAARNAKFPRFSKPSFAVKFPYRFK